ncbi:endoplasmic reticulum junction formation protein lunapark [Parasteatoda tepidariorum]|uniref:endoplasmic reticulum junction formation protein lunapark n=1 Tax=Parasteatoda tepidariorum TaxID=114398 RepID=UPI00077F8B13|nr:endoplasmic reticulum junction formation protein lunapark [Parasteatoda tepidariorum]
MGSVIHKLRSIFSFSKSPDVYKKELDEINKEIFANEQQKRALEYQYNLIKQVILSYSRLLFVLMSLIFFFSTMPSTFLEYILFCGPLLVIYLLVCSLKLSLKWYYEHEIKRIVQKLLELQSRKKKLLKEVKEKIKFSDAKAIIEEYSISKDKNKFEIQNTHIENYYKRRESSLDTVVKYVLNEEKDTALICQFCNCHNGLALEEDYECTSFRCCRCFKLNKARSAITPAIEN